MHCCCSISVYICLDHWHGSELNDLWEQHKQFIEEEEPQFFKVTRHGSKVERHLREFNATLKQKHALKKSISQKKPFFNFFLCIIKKKHN